MKKRKHLLAACVAAALLLLIFAILIVYISWFTPKGYRMTVGIHGYREILDGVWLDDSYKGDTSVLCDIYFDAQNRVESFFGEVRSTPVLIITEDESKLRRLGDDSDIMSFAIGEVYSYISVSTEKYDVDTLAHELAHAEIHKRIFNGKVSFGRVVPPWFDEGIALQLDYSTKFSWETLMRYTEDLTVLPDFELLSDEDYFYNDDPETEMYNYLAAKYELGRWLLENGGEDELVLLLDKINAGAEFTSVYDIPMTDD